MKYFVTSNINGYYEPFVKSLNEAGYQKDNPEHTLIILGGLFGHGGDPLPIFEFLNSIPKKRLLLVRGEKEDEFLKAVHKGLDDQKDMENGIAQTITSILNVPLSSLKDYVGKPMECLEKNDVYHFLRYRKWYQYVELGKYVMTADFIPTFKNGGGARHSYPVWRKVSSSAWKQAHKVSKEEEIPLISQGFFDSEIRKGRVLVSGAKPSLIKAQMRDPYGIYKDKNYICLDACPHLTDKVNVLCL